VCAHGGGCGSRSSLSLSRYPRPKYIGFDNGGEYKNEFEELVNKYGIKKKNSTPFNPQSSILNLME
jgi:hypothetical protein